MYKLIALYLLAILGIFIEPDFLGSVGNILLKLIILGGISYLIYDVWNEKEEAEKGSAEDPALARPATDAPTMEPIFENISVRLDYYFQHDPGFRNFLTGQFSICRRYTAASNGYLIYKDSDKNGRVLHYEAPYALHAEEPNAFITLMALADQHNGILIENQLHNADALFSFYTTEAYTPRALLAFKTELNAHQRLYWFFDAPENDFFNVQDKAVFEIINNDTAFGTISALEKQELNQRHATHLRALDVAKELNRAESTEECIDLISDHLVVFFEASKLTIALRTDEEKAVIYKSIGIEDPFKQGSEFSLNEGLNGWVIIKNKPYLIDNIDKGEYFIPRFTRSEKTNYSLRSFLSVPIPGENEALGMITLEDKTENKFSEEDKQNLITCADILSAGLKRFLKINKEQLEEE